MHRIIRVVFVNNPKGLPNSDIVDKKRYEYICNDSEIEIGDVFTAVGYSNYLQVVDEEYSDRVIADEKCRGTYSPISLKTVQIDRITNKNKKQPKETKMDNKKNVLSGISEKFKSLFLPEKENDIRMSLDGTLCVLVGGPASQEWVGIKGEELTSYPEEMTVEIPVYSISKPQNQVKVGDIIKTNRRYSYAKVLEVKENGQLRVLSYSGYTQNRKEVKDFIMGQSMVRVIINMFNFDNSNDRGGFNPMMLALMGDGEIDAKTLMLMQFMPGTKDSMKGFNPMMFMLLDKDSNSNDAMTTMLMMSMMQNGSNPFQINQ